ncbi:MAG: ABC transporter ATP-binding protein, partial [Gammaproteobacteria bacterium]|nr:ABC transporter ATP-binding protein [Gammaproteobacteria bacterium]
MKVIEARSLVKHYPGVEAVAGISFGVSRGECIGMLGPNGAGKTTTVEMMEGILPPTSGEILYQGKPLDADFRQVAGIQFQNTVLQDKLNVLQVLQLFHRLYRKTRPLDEIIETCNLGELLKRENRKLSGGQRQRLLLALALVNDPEVIFLDEPTTGLDPQARRNFWALIRRIKAEDKTIILTTHYMEEAYLLCDTVLIMDHGRIIAEGSPAQLLQEHFSDVVLSIPAVAWPASFPDEDCPYLVHEQAERVELSTGDVDAAIDWLKSQDIPLAGLQIRPRTLEDLFIE